MPDVQPAVDAVGNTPATTAQSGDDTDLAALRAARDELAGQLAAAEQRVASAERSRDEERREGQRRLLAWASGLAILGALICGALAVFLPIMRARLAAGAVACGVVLILAQTIAQALPWLPIIGVVLAILALASGLLLALRALGHATGLADRLKGTAALTAKEATADILNAARWSQSAAGVRGIIQRARKVPRRTKETT